MENFIEKTKNVITINIIIILSSMVLSFFNYRILLGKTKGAKKIITFAPLTIGYMLLISYSKEQLLLSIITIVITIMATFSIFILISEYIEDISQEPGKKKKYTFNYVLNEEEISEKRKEEIFRKIIVFVSIMIPLFLSALLINLK